MSGAGAECFSSDEETGVCGEFASELCIELGSGAGEEEAELERLLASCSLI